MMSDSVKSNIESLCANLENFVSTKTVVGEAITIGNRNYKGGRRNTDTCPCGTV